MITVLPLGADVATRLQALAASSRAREICGLIGRQRRSHRPRLWPIDNIACRDDCRFEMDPAGQIRAFRGLREAGAELMAIYHSHPRGEAEPSIHDVRGHSYPRALAVIVAPAATFGPAVRAWRLAGARFVEVEITMPSAFL